MGSLFSKEKKSKEPQKKPNSAPARLEGLDGTTPKAGSPSGSNAETRVPTPLILQRTSKDGDSREERIGSRSNKVAPVIEVSPVPPAPAPARPPSAGPSKPLPFDERPAKAGPSKPLPFDERPAKAGAYKEPTIAVASPTGNKGPKKVDVLGKQTDGQKLAADLPAAVTIPEEAQHWVQVWGERVVRNLHSADWKDREQGLNSMTRSLQSSKFISSNDDSKVYAVTCEILSKLLKDKVAPLYHASLELTSTLLATYCASLAAAPLRAGADALVPILMHRCGNLNSRIHEASLQALMGIAGTQNLGSAYLGPFALAPLPKKSQGASQVAQMSARLELISSLLGTFRSTQGLGVEETLKFTKQGLEMPDEKVRQAAIQVIVELYRLRKMAGDDLEPEKYLGPVKPALLQLLQARFQAVAAELEAGGPARGAVGNSEVPAVATGVRVVTGGGGSRLPPLKGSSLPPLKGASPASGLEVSGTSLSASAPFGKPPRTPNGAGVATPTPPSSAPRSGPRPRMRMGVADAADTVASSAGAEEVSPATTPLRASASLKARHRMASPAGRPGTAQKLQPADAVSVVDMVPPGSAGKEGSKPSSKAGSRAGSKPPSLPGSAGSGERAKVLDDHEEQLIEYILNDRDMSGI